MVVRGSKRTRQVVALVSLEHDRGSTDALPQINCHYGRRGGIGRHARL